MEKSWSYIFYLLHANAILQIVVKFIFYILVLEFELRKAHETIKALRGSLTEATGKSY